VFLPAGLRAFAPGLGIFPVSATAHRTHRVDHTIQRSDHSMRLQESRLAAAGPDGADFRSRVPGCPVVSGGIPCRIRGVSLPQLFIRLGPSNVEPFSVAEFDLPQRAPYLSIAPDAQGAPVDYGFRGLFRVEPLAGRFYFRSKVQRSEVRGTDVLREGPQGRSESLSLIINETAARGRWLPAPRSAVNRNPTVEPSPFRKCRVGGGGKVSQLPRSSHIIGVIPESSWSSRDGGLRPSRTMSTPAGSGSRLFLCEARTSNPFRTRWRFAVKGSWHRIRTLLRRFVPGVHTGGSIDIQRRYPATKSNHYSRYSRVRHADRQHWPAWVAFHADAAGTPWRIGCARSWESEPLGKILRFHAGA